MLHQPAQEQMTPDPQGTINTVKISPGKTFTRQKEQLVLSTSPQLRAVSPVSLQNNLGQAQYPSAHERAQNLRCRTGETLL